MDLSFVCFTREVGLLIVCILKRRTTIHACPMNYCPESGGLLGGSLGVSLPGWMIV